MTTIHQHGPLIVVSWVVDSDGKAESLPFAVAGRLDRIELADNSAAAYDVKLLEPAGLDVLDGKLSGVGDAAGETHVYLAETLTTESVVLDHVGWVRLRIENATAGSGGVVRLYMLP